MRAQVGSEGLAPTHLQPRRKKDVGGQDYIPAALSPQDTTVFFVQDDGWT